MSFIGTGSLKAIRAYRELRKANALLTLESVACSPKLQKEITHQACKQFSAREAILKNRSLKIKWDDQGKHIPGRHNYEPDRGRSIFTHKDPQKLVNEFAGKGQKMAREFPGELGYKERVDFGEQIGYYIDLKTGKSYATTMGSIEYAKDGVHIVPRQPLGFKP